MVAALTSKFRPNRKQRVILRSRHDTQISLPHAKPVKERQQYIATRLDTCDACQDTSRLASHVVVLLIFARLCTLGGFESMMMDFHDYGCINKSCGPSRLITLFSDLQNLRPSLISFHHLESKARIHVESGVLRAHIQIHCPSHRDSSADALQAAASCTENIWKRATAGEHKCQVSSDRGNVSARETINHFFAV